MRLKKIKQLIIYKLKHYHLYCMYHRNRTKYSPIILNNEKYRGCGISTIIIKDALHQNIPVLVDTFATKRHHIDLMCKISAEQHYNYSYGYIRDNLVITLNEDFRGKNVRRVLADCSWDTYMKCIINNPLVHVVNGFCGQYKEK